MALYKASTAIPELNKSLVKVGIGEDAIGKYYDKLSHFELYDNQGIEYDTAESVLCVLYNILSRGVPTSGSLSLSTSLLQKRFPGQTPTHNCKDEREFVITFNPIFTAALTAEELIAYNNHLVNWNEQSAGFVSGELGTNAFMLFSLLEDLRKVAFMQKALVFALFANLRKVKLNVYLDIQDDELASLIVIDTIELLTALCTLSDKQMPYVSYTNEHSVADVIIGTSWGRFENYHQFSKPFLYVNAYPALFTGNDNGEQQLKQPIASFLSSSKILYKDLGFSVESDDESIPAFEFYNNKRKEAIEFLLQNLFRKKDFRPGQLAIINRALQNKDVIGLLPTGGGKSLCFQLCGLLQPGVNLVIDPINSLMKDQYDKLQDYYIGCSGFINSLNNIESEYGTDDGMTLNDVILQRFMDGQLLFLFISPERLLIQKFRNALTSCVGNHNNIHYCVIDEAHCVSEWGHDFRIPYLRLADNLRRFCSNHNNAPILFALTATASFDVLADVQREMNLQADSIIALPPGAINRKELTYNIFDLSEHNASLEYPNREFDLSAPKYQRLCELFDQMPMLVTKAGTKSPLLDDHLKSSFYTKKDGRYDNAGIIFCTTRSEKLPGGVVSMYDRLSASCDFFEAGTYFAPTDSETVLAAVIDERAHNSGKNQEMFLADKLNLMI